MDDLLKIRSARKLQQKHQNNPQENDHHIEDNNASSLVCQICLDPFLVGQKIAMPKIESCGHSFHQRCITPWLRRNNTCPCCRKIYIQQNSRLSHKLRCWDKTIKSGSNISKYNFCQIHGIIHSNQCSAIHNNKSTDPLDESNSKTESTQSGELDV